MRDTAVPLITDVRWSSAQTVPTPSCEMPSHATKRKPVPAIGLYQVFCDDLSDHPVPTMTRPAWLCAECVAFAKLCDLRPELVVSPPSGRRPMSARYLDAKDIAEVAHDAVFRAWFRLSGSLEMSPWRALNDHVKRDATDTVSARIRVRYQNDRLPTSITPEYGAFWRTVVDAAVELKYDPSVIGESQP